MRGGIGAVSRRRRLCPRSIAFVATAAAAASFVPRLVLPCVGDVCPLAGEVPMLLPLATPLASAVAGQHTSAAGPRGTRGSVLCPGNAEAAVVSIASV